MKKTLFVVAVVLICTLAATAKDTIYNFTLLDTYGNKYCNVLWLRLYTPGAPVPKILVGGWYYNAACSGTYAPEGGFKHGISNYLQYNGTGAVLDVSTPAYVPYGDFSNWQLLINPVYHTWTAYKAYDSYGNYLWNYGTWKNGYTPETKGAKDAKDAATR